MLSPHERLVFYTHHTSYPLVKSNRAFLVGIAPVHRAFMLREMAVNPDCWAVVVKDKDLHDRINSAKSRMKQEEQNSATLLLNQIVEITKQLEKKRA